MVVDVRFLGVPHIFVDGTEILIPQKKLAALLFYVLYHTCCTRDDLITVFWGMLGEEKARQNLRNALYRLKMELGDEFLVVNNRTVSLHPGLEVHRDTDALTEEDGGAGLLALDSVVFLDTLNLRDTPEFEKWVISMQAAHEKIILDRLEGNMRESLRTGASAAEDYARKLLEISPYHEEAARVLIRRLANLGQYTEAIEIYNNLVRCLQSELDINPEEATRALYEKVLELRDSHQLSKQNWIISQRHGHILDFIRSEHTRFLSGQDYHHCVIEGVTGTGKSIILRSFVQGLETQSLIRVRFEFVNADIPYYAVGKLLPLLAEQCGLKLPEPSYNDFETLKLYHLISMDKLISRMTSRNLKLTLLIENLEAVDRRSMDIILSHLLDKCYGKVMLVGEFCTSFSPDRRLIGQLELLENVKLLPLSPLTLQETAAYLSKELPAEQIHNMDLCQIWKKTDGYPVLLNAEAERIAGRSRRPGDMVAEARRKLSVLLSSLNTEERYCIELLSIFPYGAELRTLAALSGSHAAELPDVIEQLCHRGLVTDEECGGLLLARIPLEAFRTAVYERISRLRRTELHRVAAEYFRDADLPARMAYFRIRELKYHYSMVGPSYEQVYYSLEELRFRLDYCDEFFPTLKITPELLDSVYLSKQEVYSAFDLFLPMRNSLSDKLPPEQLYDLDLTYSYLKGRTLIRDSRIDEGMVYIRRVLVTAREMNREDMVLKGCLEVIFASLRREDGTTMRTYIGNARSLSILSTHEVEQGVLLRLEAMCDIMAGDYNRAEELLLRSIHILEQPHLRTGSAMNIAAAYDYLSTIHRERGDFEKAHEALNAAISLCAENNVKKNLDLFYEDLGYLQFLEGDYRSARESFDHSMELYNYFDSNWLRSVCESCLAMISAYEGRNQEALDYYRRAEIFSKKNRTSQELRILEQARKVLQASQIL